MKIVLAYSGGLDTSVALKWLKDHYEADIIAFCADVGQNESLHDIEEKALATGAYKVYIEDLRAEFLQEYAFPALQAHAAYEGQYLLAAPLARPLIAKRLVEIAHRENAEAVAHGATGKGNDQVRFYTSIIALDPQLQVIAPVPVWEMKSREDEIAYAIQHQIPITITPAKPYSLDTNIWGTSAECGCLDDITLAPPDEVYQMTVSPAVAPDIVSEVQIDFELGKPVALNGTLCSAVELVTELNERGGAQGIGRIDILENRVVGIKTRGVYESPAATILQAAHRELENLVLDKDTLHYKQALSQRYAELVYNGLWFSPLRQALDAFVTYTQKRVTGSVRLRLYKGTITVLSRSSEFALYDYALSTYDGQDRFNHAAGLGFSYIWSLPLRIAATTGATGAPEEKH